MNKNKDLERKRKSMRWTQADAARICAVSRRTYQRYENGEKPMNARLFEWFMVLKDDPDDKK